LLSVESWQLRAGRDRAAGPPRAQRCHLGGRGGQLRLVPLGGRSFGLAITSQTTRRPSCVSGGRWVRQWGACTARDLGPCVPVSLRAPLPKGRRCSSAVSGWRCVGPWLAGEPMHLPLHNLALELRLQLLSRAHHLAVPLLHDLELALRLVTPSLRTAQPALHRVHVAQRLLACAWI
jgi:hypothetical protein